jgi:hypothetical protein
MPNDPTPARPELPEYPAARFQPQQLVVHSDLVRTLLARERRKALIEAAYAARGCISALGAEAAILKLIDRKEPTT